MFTNMSGRVTKSVVALLVAGVVAAIAWWGVAQLRSGESYFELWTYPAVRVYVDGAYVGEAPSTTRRLVNSGSHRITVQPKNGDPPISFSKWFRSGRAYLIKIDQETRTQCIERILS